MLQSGYPADFILGLAVESMNGVRNRAAAGDIVQEADPDFVRALQLIRDVQVAGGVGMRVEEDKAKGSTTVLFFRREDLPEDILAKSAEIRRLLKLTGDPQKFVLNYPPVRGTDNELTVNSRSMLQILQAFSSQVEVPAQHLKEKWAAPAIGISTSGPQVVGRIRSGTERPEEAYVAVQYGGHWFWVDDSDWQAKRALAAVIFFFTLMEGTGSEQLPLVTIPAQ